MKVNPNEYSRNRPTLNVEDLEDEAAVLTCSAVEEVDLPDSDAPGGVRKSLLLKFEESEDKALWLNKTQIDYLIERLGDDSDDWIGQHIPVEKHETTFRGKTHHKVWVSPPESWDEMLEAAGVTPPRKAKSKAVKSGTVKRGRK